MSKKIEYPQLTITTEEDSRCINLNLGRTTIGRKSDNTVVISDLSVSGHHATITIFEDEAIIEDLGSTNGTYVDKEKIDMPFKLSNSAPIVIGLSHLLFTMNKPPAEEGEQTESTKTSSLKETSSYKDTRTTTQASLEFLAEDKSLIQTMVLDKTVNPLGRLGVGVAAISLSRNGWVLSPVDGLTPLLNGNAVTTTAALLKNGDVIALGDLQARFVI